MREELRVLSEQTALVAEALRALSSTVTSCDSGTPAPEPIITLPKTPAPKTPTSQRIYYLPRDSNQAEMTEIYGPASKDFEGRLDWFHWPTGVEARLYTRDGAHITDHTPNNAIFADDHRTHTMLAPRVTGALQELYEVLGRERFLAEGWQVFSGSFKYKMTTGGGYISTHSRAAACDWNDTENGYRSKTTTFSDEAFDVWERWGFLCAWRAWVNTRDPMHIQAAIPSITKGSYYDKHGLPSWIKPLSARP